jgi:hypothetical protein
VAAYRIVVPAVGDANEGVLNLSSPTLEEVNDMWGMLGGKQLPFGPGERRR